MKPHGNLHMWQLRDSEHSRHEASVEALCEAGPGSDEGATKGTIGSHPKNTDQGDESTITTSMQQHAVKNTPDENESHNQFLQLQNKFQLWLTLNSMTKVADS